MTAPRQRPAPHVAAALAAIQAKPTPRSRSHSPAPHVQAALETCAQPRMPGPALLSPAAGSRPAFVLPSARPPARPSPRTAAVQAYRRPAAVVQRAQWNFATVDIDDPTIYSNPKFPWDEYGTWQREQERVQSVNNRPVLPPQIVVVGSQNHLDTFAKKTDTITVDTPANHVLVRSSVNGGPVTPVATPDATLEGAITRPQTSNAMRENAVRDTIADGEVAPLIAALKAFRSHMNKNPGQDLSFELAFSGSHGACDGCKSRIDRFVSLWTEYAAGVMRTGSTARLKFTYRYLVPATGFPREWGENVYGWEGDGFKSPYLHTVEASVRGEQ